VNWKKEIQINDLDPDTLIEVICRKCGNGRYASQSEILEMPGMQRAYMDEVEKAMRCHMRFCKGHILINLIYDDKTEGFVGGMA
jgi:hypothetical protein